MGISILDMQGRNIRKLMENSIVPAGRFQIYWDGKDRDGRTAAHGTYLYRIEGEKSGSRSGRIVLEN
jgi:flagellar hook assembly protein FlgD